MKTALDNSRTATELSPQGQVSDMLTSLDACNGELENLTDTLQSRLSSILNDETPILTKPNEKQDKPVLVPLALQMDKVLHRMQNSCASIRQLLSRIEL